MPHHISFINNYLVQPKKLTGPAKTLFVYKVVIYTVQPRRSKGLKITTVVVAVRIAV